MEPREGGEELRERQGAVAVGVEGGELLQARLQRGAVHMEERLQALSLDDGGLRGQVELERRELEHDVVH